MSISMFRGLLIVLPLFLLGGSSVSVPATDLFIFQWRVSDPSVDPEQTTSFCKPGRLTGTSLPERCIFPPNMTVSLVQFGVTLSEAFTTAATEDCQFTVWVGTYSDSTGNAISSSLIEAGEAAAAANAAGTCRPTSFVLNAAGENCIRDIDPTDSNATLSSGGWWSVQVTEAGGLGTCDDVVAADLLAVWEKQ